MSALLSMEHLTGGYGEADILHDVSMSVSQDEIVVIVGPNGAGKSTAMKSVFGLLTIRGGKMQFDGVDITDYPKRTTWFETISARPSVQAVKTKSGWI